MVRSLSRCQRMLLGIAVGDAFGAGCEMDDRKAVSERFDFTKYSSRKGRKPGKYTDDTQMSIAVAELILSRKEFTKINFADYFVDCYHRDPHAGYSRVMKEALSRSHSGKDLLKNISGDSIRNGACMRAVPLGILPEIKDVISAARVNAQVTHNTPKGMASSVCIAAASHYFYYKLGRPKGVFNYCINACRGIDRESLRYFKSVRDMRAFDAKLLFGRENEHFGVPCDGMRTAGAVLYLVSKFKGAQVLKQAILLGGDTDSVASISFGIAAVNGLAGLPKFLFKGLENGKYGRDYLIEVGGRLCAKRSGPLVIGVAGRSCSGKSEVTKYLEKVYRNHVVRIPSDNFFKIRIPKNIDKRHGWETPATIMWDRLIRCVSELKRGKSTYIPSERRTEVFDKKLDPKDIIIVEGYLLYTNRELVNLIDEKIWVDVSDINMLRRRARRSGRIMYIIRKVIPVSKKYEKTQRNRADIIIDGNKSKEHVRAEVNVLMKRMIG